MNPNLKLHRENFWLAIVFFIALSFTWSERLSSVGIIFLSIHWLLDKQLLDKIRSFKLKPFIATCWLFFLLHIVACIWTHYPDFAMQTIMVKLSFLVIPFLLSTENYFNNKSKQSLMYAFSISLCVSFMYTLGLDLLLNFDKGKIVYLNRMQISEAIMHPGYYSNYFALAMVWCGYEVSNYRTKSNYQLLWLGGIFLMLSLALLLLISKTAILFIGIFFLFLLWKFLDRIKNIVGRMLAYLLALSFIIFLAIQIPSIKYRIHETQRDTGTISKEVSIMNSTGSRITAWQNSWKLIQEKTMWGYGTGSANAQLKQKLLDEGYTNLANDNMHTHNQLFHTWLDIGFLGIVFIILIWVSSAYHFVKLKNTLGIWLIVLMVLNLLTDDMLEIQAGIVFFVFFLCLFYYQKTTLDATVNKTEHI